MNTRDFTNVLKAQLQRIDGRTSPWSKYEFNIDLHDEVHDQLLFFPDINSFPLVSFSVEDERIVHAEGNERYSLTSIEIRGYTYDEEVEQSGELIAQDIEHVLEHLRSEDRRIEEIRVMSVNTDSGTNAPYGACIINIEALYRR